MKKVVLSILAGVSLLFAPAQAALLDFVAEAAGNERGVRDGTTLNINGIDVTFSATGGSAYFDDLSGGPGGLGVCTVLGRLNGTDDQCIPSSDDNLGAGETVTVAFDSPQTISGLVFHDSSHQPLAGSTATLIINGMSMTFLAATQAVFADIASMTFEFEGTAFYVSAMNVETPLPAAALFMLTGLAGVGVSARSKRRAAKTAV